MPYKNLDLKRAALKRAYAKVKKARKVYLKGKKCVDCGSKRKRMLAPKDGLVANLKSLWSRSLTVRNEILDKCDIVCFKCYMKRYTIMMRKLLGKEITHGTVVGYDGRGCRCDLCRTARREARQRRFKIVGHW